MKKGENGSQTVKMSKVSIKMAADTPRSRKKSEEDKILSKIIQLTNDYSAKGIAQWRTAVALAENFFNPNRLRLYDLYKDLAYDLHYQYLNKTLRDTATGARFNIIDTASKKMDDEAKELFNASWFVDFIKHKTDTPFWGHTLLELQQADAATNNVVFKLIPRKNVIPEVGGWTVYPGDQSATIYRDTPAMDWLIEMGDTHELGMLNIMAKEILAKKVAAMCWMEFTERFGMPLIKGKTNTRDSKALDRMESFFKKVASSSYAIVDVADDIDFVESAKTDSYNVYDKLIERHNREMSKAVILNVLAGDTAEKGTKALGAIHQDSGKQANKAWLKEVENTINGQLIPLLIKHGFPLEGKRFEYIEEKQVDKDTFEQDKWAFDTYEIPDAYYAEKYGWPIQGRKEKADTSKTSQSNSEGIKTLLQKAATGDFHQTVQLHNAIQELYQHKH